MVEAEKSSEEIKAQIRIDLDKLLAGSSGWNSAYRITLKNAFSGFEKLVDEVLREKGYLN